MLSHLTLNQWYTEYSAAISALELEDLEIRGSTVHDVTSLPAMPYLKRLCIDNLDKDSLSPALPALFRACPMLQELVIELPRYINRDGLTFSTVHHALPQTLTRLELAHFKLEMGDLVPSPALTTLTLRDCGPHAESIAAGLRVTKPDLRVDVKTA